MIDEDHDGRLDLREHYNEKKTLVKSEEDVGCTGYLNTVWFYSETEEGIRAEIDNNNDGNVDVWYFYEHGRVNSVEEDTNGDGKVDLWEEYDDAEAIVKRKKDLDYDGIPDIEEFAGEMAGRRAGEQAGK